MIPERKTNLRRPPKQERSRERVDEILSAAKHLIGQKGIDAVTMREIAERAGGPISSVYQYFPNKSAIIATLYNHWSIDLYALLKARLEPANSLTELFEAVITVLDIYWQQIYSDPAILDMLNAIQADKTLKNMDVAETRRQASLFAEIARPWIADERFADFHRMTFLMFQLANGAVRLALAVERDEARAVIGDYKSMIRTQLWQFAKA